uniref:Uncharacterized protein n=1 Tax=Cyprinus carpio TaxID=7962 RepID=A0A8C2H6F1_CYPCA
RGLRHSTRGFGTQTQHERDHAHLSEEMEVKPNDFDISSGNMEFFETAAASLQASGRQRSLQKWWCFCTKCYEMPTEVESICCHEWKIAMSQLQDADEDIAESVPSHTCLTEDPDRVLHIVYFATYKLGATSKARGTNVSAGWWRIVWFWSGFLPSCVVKAICKKYPSPS